jgi:hypothetical protein
MVGREGSHEAAAIGRQHEARIAGGGLSGVTLPKGLLDAPAQTLHPATQGVTAHWFIEAMWLMLQQEEPDDYIIATGEADSVRDFVELVFETAGFEWRRHVEVDRRYFRPTEVDALRGDHSKARRVLGWGPRVSFAELVKMMVDHDIDLAAPRARAGSANCLEAL